MGTNQLGGFLKCTPLGSGSGCLGKGPQRPRVCFFCSSSSSSPYLFPKLSGVGGCRGGGSQLWGAPQSAPRLGRGLAVWGRVLSVALLFLLSTISLYEVEKGVIEGAKPSRRGCCLHRG